MQQLEAKRDGRFINAVQMHYRIETAEGRILGFIHRETKGRLRWQFYCDEGLPGLWKFPTIGDVLKAVSKGIS